MALLQAAFALPRTPPGVTEPLIGVAAGHSAGLVRRRGLVVVVSDFLDAPETWEQPLRHLTVRHQVLAVEVLDPRELSLPDVGILTLIDPETGRRREVPRATRACAAGTPRRRPGNARIAQGLRRAGASHLRLRTDRDWVRDLVKHVMRQRRLAMLACPPEGGGDVA